jgi:hypothetical protein
MVLQLPLNKCFFEIHEFGLRVHSRNLLGEEHFIFYQLLKKFALSANTIFIPEESSAPAIIILPRRHNCWPGEKSLYIFYCLDVRAFVSWRRENIVLNLVMKVDTIYPVGSAKRLIWVFYAQRSAAHKRIATYPLTPIYIINNNNSTLDIYCSSHKHSGTLFAVLLPNGNETLSAW